MSDERPRGCRLHPDSPIGMTPRVNLGQCWVCEGRPPSWVCATCGRRYPCDHNRAHPSLTRDESDAYSRVLRAHEAVVNGAADRATFERALSEFQRAVRSGYAEKLAQGSMN